MSRIKLIGTTHLIPAEKIGLRFKMNQELFKSQISKKAKFYTKLYLWIAMGLSAFNVIYGYVLVKRLNWDFLIIIGLIWLALQNIEIQPKIINIPKGLRR
jgi:hypothetical protein